MKKTIYNLKRIIAFLLSVTIISASLPYNASAEEEIVTETVVETPVETETEAATETPVETETETVAETPVETETEPATEVQVETETEPVAEALNLSETQIDSEEVSVQSEDDFYQGENVAETLDTSAENATETLSGTPAESPAETQPVIGDSVSRSGAGDNAEDSTPDQTLLGGAGAEKTYVTPTVDISDVGEINSPQNGAEIGYNFTFKEQGESDASKVYSAYVYGYGVDQTTLTELAKAYFYGIQGANYEYASVKNINFVDAEKHSVDFNYNDSVIHYYNEELDSELCWAYAASDALYQAGWTKYFDAGIFNVEGSASSYFQSEDDLVEYAAYCFNNAAGYEREFWNWIFTGNYDCPDDLRYGLDPNDQLLNAYYTNSIFEEIDFYENAENKAKQKQCVYNTLNRLATCHDATTAGIYYDAGGGHAVSLTGFIKDSTGEPVALIFADPDNGVCDTNEPNDPRLKSNIYTVYPIKYSTIYIKGGGWTEGYVFSSGFGDKDDTLLGELSVISNSSNKTKVNASKIPVETRGISDSFDNSKEYYFNSDYTFYIPVNASFLSYYDINKIKYSLYDEEGTLIADTSVACSKDTLAQMVSENVTELSLTFESALKDLSNGKYHVEATIDKECFYGNYGWFALKANGGAGYFDKLVDTWITLYRQATEPDNDEKESESVNINIEPIQNKKNQLTETEIAILNATSAAIVQEIISQMDGDYPTEQAKAHVQETVTDILKALAKDEEAIAKFAAAGIDLSNKDIRNLKVVSSVNAGELKSGKLTLSMRKYGNLKLDSTFALIKLANGRTMYVKVKVGVNGDIEIDVPESAKEISVFSL